MKIYENKTWFNTIKKHGGEIPIYCLPESKEDISQLIILAERDGKRIKAVGSGHSFSDVALPDTYLVDLKKLNSVLPLDRSTLTSEAKNLNLVSVESGITVQKFNKKMDKLNLCIVNMGGIDEQTLAGAISTGTHGTGIDLPSFPGMVRSLEIVTTAGKTLKIEPTNGITDAARFNEADIELVQDDDTFYSAVLSLGCFGIIYSFTLELLPMYYLEESKVIGNWSEVKPILADRSLLSDSMGNPYRGVMVQINPYKNENNDHTCVIVRHKLLDKKPRRSIGDATRNWITGIIGNLPISYISYWIASRRVARNIHKFPKMIENALKHLKDKRYENKGYKVLYQGAEFIKTKAFDSEFAFDMTNFNNDFISATEEIFSYAKTMKDVGLFQTTPIGIRFVGPSAAYLSPEFGKTVAYIDTPFLIGTPELDRFLMGYQQIMLENNGIPHWGKINTILDSNKDQIIRHYPKLKTWEEKLNQFDPHGTFSNKFSDRLNLGRLTSNIA